MISNLLIKILEDAPIVVEETNESALEQILKVIQDVLNLPVITIAGTTLTIGLIAFAILKFFLPSNKIVINQEKTISQLESENAVLKENQSNYEARISTLEAKMDVITANTPNKKVQDAKNLKVEPQKIVYINANHTNKKRKKVKIKVKKVVDKAVDKVQDTITDAISSGGVVNG